MKQQANLIRAGQVNEHEGQRWTVLKQQIITPGKGGAFIQVEMRNLKTGNKTNERWRTADTVERLQTDNRDYTYSYTDGDNLVLAWAYVGLRVLHSRSGPANGDSAASSERIGRLHVGVRDEHGDWSHRRCRVPGRHRRSGCASRELPDLRRRGRLERRRD